MRTGLRSGAEWLTEQPTRNMLLGTGPLMVQWDVSWTKKGWAPLSSGREPGSARVGALSTGPSRVAWQVGLTLPEHPLGQVLFWGCWAQPMCLYQWETSPSGEGALAMLEGFSDGGGLS